MYYNIITISNTTIYIYIYLYIFPTQAYQIHNIHIQILHTAKVNSTMAKSIIM
jgi:hypothetical protein